MDELTVDECNGTTPGSFHQESNHKWETQSNGKMFDGGEERSWNIVSIVFPIARHCIQTLSFNENEKNKLLYPHNVMFS